MSPRMSHSNYHKICYLVARTITNVCKIAIGHVQNYKYLYFETKKPSVTVQDFLPICSTDATHCMDFILKKHQKKTTIMRSLLLLLFLLLRSSLPVLFFEGNTYRDSCRLVQFLE